MFHYLNSKTMHFTTSRQMLKMGVLNFLDVPESISETTQIVLKHLAANNKTAEGFEDFFNVEEIIDKFRSLFSDQALVELDKSLHGEKFGRLVNKLSSTRWQFTRNFTDNKIAKAKLEWSKNVKNFL